MKQNIITTILDFKKIHNTGCIVCGNNIFEYTVPSQNFICKHCGSTYAISIEGIMNMLLEKDTDIRIYKQEKILIDDDQHDQNIYVSIKNKQKKLTKNL